MTHVPMHEFSGVLRLLDTTGNVWAEFNSDDDTWQVTDADGILRAMERAPVGLDGFGVLRMAGTIGDPAAREFDGVTDWVQLLGSQLGSTVFSSDFTVVFDCVVPNNTTNKYFMERGHGIDRFLCGQFAGGFGVGTSQGWSYIHDGVDALMKTGTYVIQHDTGLAGFNRWHVWLDGVLQDTTGFTSGTSNDIGASSEDLSLGRRDDAINHMAMTIRNTRLYGDLKSVAEVAADDGTDSDLLLWWKMIDPQSSVIAQDFSPHGRHGVYRGTISV